MTVKRRACTKCGKNRAERFYVSARGRVCSYCRRSRTRAGSKNVRLQLTYDITLEDYTRLLAHQRDGCAICGGKRSSYDVDHDHAKEREGVPIRYTIRGLLCKRCNRRLLPAATDSPAVLWGAIHYLQHPPAQDVLE